MFQLTKEQETNSITIYGKIIRCIIAPYHNYVEHQAILTSIMGNTAPVYVFPERDLTIQQRKSLLSTFVSSQLTEINFITADLFIINDMINGCCRLLTPDAKLEEVREKTFMANAHDIILKVLQNDRYDSVYTTTKNLAKDRINAVIAKIHNAKTITSVEKTKLQGEIDLIGEYIISTKLKEMLDDIRVV